MFIASIPVLLRLSLLPGAPVAHIPAMLAHSLHWIAEFERDIPVPPPGSILPSLRRGDRNQSVTLHRSQQLFDPPPSLSIETWGECIEALWRVSMTWPERTQTWDAITSRLLLWRSIAEGSTVGEWARRQVIENL